MPRLPILFRRAGRDAAVRGALALRAPALALLAGRAPDAAGRAALGAPAAAWELFLAAECCAIPVARALRMVGAWDSLSPDARAAVAAAESREMQRVLAARGQLAELDRLAAAFGVMPIVLKGGATVAEGTALDLGDIDLLVTGDVAATLAAALVARGYAPSGDALVRPGALPIELHDHVSYGRAGGAGDRAARPAESCAAGPWTGASCVSLACADEPPLVPLAGCRALRRLVGAPAVLLLLRHGVLHHPFRRGHLRDLVVLAEAIGRCTPDAVDAVSRACAADPDAADLTETLALALAIRAGADVADPPAVRRMATHKYLFALGTWRRAVRIAPRWPTLLCAAIDRPAARHAPLRDALASREQTDPHWELRRLARHAPRLAAAARGAARLPYRVVLVLCALGAGPFARRRVARLAR